MYNLEKYLRDNKVKTKEQDKIVYCRVSNKKQKFDLERQIEYMKNIYKNHKIITDICHDFL